MKTITFIRLTAALMLAALANLDAQETPFVSRGAHVRISTFTITRLFDQISAQIREKRVETEAVIGTVAELTADTLKLKIAKRPTLLAIPLATVKKLEISRGHIPRGKNVIKGGGIGLLVGAGVGALVVLMFDDTSSNETPTTGWMLLFGGIGGGSGLVVGSVLGAGISTDRWEEIPLETLRAGLSPQGD